MIASFTCSTKSKFPVLLLGSFVKVGFSCAPLWMLSNNWKRKTSKCVFGFSGKTTSSDFWVESGGGGSTELDWNANENLFKCFYIFCFTFTFNGRGGGRGEGVKNSFWPRSGFIIRFLVKSLKFWLTSRPLPMWEICWKFDGWLIMSFVIFMGFFPVLFRAEFLIKDSRLLAVRLLIIEDTTVVKKWLSSSKAKFSPTIPRLNTKGSFEVSVFESWFYSRRLQRSAGMNDSEKDSNYDKSPAAKPVRDALGSRAESSKNVSRNPFQSITHQRWSSPKLNELAV